MKQLVRNTLLWLAYMSAWLGICLLFGCKSKEVVSEIPVVIEGVRIDSTSTTVTNDCKVYVADTFIVTLNEQGDTVKIRENHWNRERKDSIVYIYTSTRDSIPVPVYVTKYETRAEIPEIMWWAIGILASTIFGMIIVIWITRKKAKQE